MIINRIRLIMIIIMIIIMIMIMRILIIIRLVVVITHRPLSNKKASHKKLDSQISSFNRKSKDLIRKSNENSLLRDKKSRPSLEKSYFLLDRWGCKNLARPACDLMLTRRL